MSTKLSYRKLGVAYVIWCLGWILLQAYALWYTFNFDWETAVRDSLLTNVLIGLSGYMMISSMRFYQPGKIGQLATSIALAFLCVFLNSKLSKPLVSEIESYLYFFNKSLLIRGLYSWLMITLITALGWLIFTLNEQVDTNKRNSAMEQLAREAELSKIRQQLQPHFLFNSLNSISALAGSKPEQARKMIQQLSDFLRGTLKKDDQQLTTLGEELEHLELYLEIEKVRFGHRLKTVVERTEESLSLKLPSLLLQPIVENAIKFGLYDTTGETVIKLAADIQDGMLLVTTTNPFDPSTAQPRHGTGYGLSSIQRRLFLLYGRQDLLTTRQLENIFITELKIPQLA